MTLTQVRDQARALARVDSNSASNAHVNDLINDALEQFGKDVSGFPMKTYLTLAAKFDVRTNMAFSLDITDSVGAAGCDLTAVDIVITAADYDDISGTTLATYLTTQINAALVAAGSAGTVTVTWNADFYFTITPSTATVTSIIVAARVDDVTYIDVTDMLFGGSKTQTDGHFDGSFPEDCTIESDLPDNIFQIDAVEWDQIKLTETTQAFTLSPQATGTPTNYYIKNKKIRLYPVPSDQKLFKITYRGIPSRIVYKGYQEWGLSKKTWNSATGLTAGSSYIFQYQLDGSTAALTDSTVTIGSDLTYNGLIQKINSVFSGATATIYGGDVKVESNTIQGASYISITSGAAGSTFIVTKLGGAVDSSVAPSETISDIPSEYHMALAYWAAAQLLIETFEDDLAVRRMQLYRQQVSRYLVEIGNQNVSIPEGLIDQSLNYRVIV